MASNTAIEDEQIGNDVKNTDEEEVDETGKIDDKSAAKAKKKRKKKKKNKGGKIFLFFRFVRKIESDYFLAATTVTPDGQPEVNGVSNGTEAIAALTIQPDGREHRRTDLSSYQDVFV